MLEEELQDQLVEDCRHGQEFQVSIGILHEVIGIEREVLVLMVSRYTDVIFGSTPVHSPSLSVRSCWRRAMIELGPEQRQTIAQGQPVQIIDPLTHDAYVLVRAEDYARLTEASPRPAGQPHPEIPPMILRSQRAFWRDLPGLLLDRRNHRKWAPYHGDERVAIARTKVDAYQECFRRGVHRGEFYVGKLEANPDGLPPWGTIECDRSLYEATDPVDGALDDE
jgi:hypothetical protein